MTETEITEPCLHPQDWPPRAPLTARALTVAPPSIAQAMSTLGAVTLATRAKAQQVMDYCRAEFGRNPGVLWGKDSNPANSEHYSGRAVDFMITHHGRGIDSDLGNAITRYLLARAADWDLAWVIWAQRLYYPDGTSYLMEDRGSTTNNHYDHPHAYFRSDRLITGSKTTPSYTDRQTQEEDDMQLTDTITRPDGHKGTVGDVLAYLDMRMERLEAAILGRGLPVYADDGTDTGDKTDLATEAAWNRVNARRAAEAAGLSEDDIERLMQAIADSTVQVDVRVTDVAGGAK